MEFYLISSTFFRNVFTIFRFFLTGGCFFLFVKLWLVILKFNVNQIWQNGLSDFIFSLLSYFKIIDIKLISQWINWILFLLPSHNTYWTHSADTTHTHNKKWKYKLIKLYNYLILIHVYSRPFLVILHISTYQLKLWSLNIR